jgi:NitT/TauT family transport system substrate-binding protein
MSKFSKLTAALLVAAAVQLPAARAQSEELQKVRIINGNPQMISAVFELYVPLAMGWWTDMGLDPEVVFSQGTSAAVQSIIGGSGDIGMGNTTPWLSADVKGLAKFRMVASMRNTSWRILTLANSSVTKASDLAGKTIGIGVAGTGGLMYLNSMLKKEGIDPERGAKQAVIGIGAQSFEALKSGMVDASLTFMSEIATFKALGNEANYFYDDAWLDFPDYGVFVTDEISKSDPVLVEKIARGIAMAQVFGEANPACVAKIFQTNYGKGSNLTEDQALAIAQSNVDDAKIPFERAGGKYHAAVSADGIGKLQNFLKDNGLFEQTVDVATLLPEDPDFFARVNDFDHDAVIAQAKACEGY